MTIEEYKIKQRYPTIEKRTYSVQRISDTFQISISKTYSFCKQSFFKTTADYVTSYKDRCFSWQDFFGICAPYYQTLKNEFYKRDCIMTYFIYFTKLLILKSANHRGVYYG